MVKTVIQPNTLEDGVTSDAYEVQLTGRDNNQIRSDKELTLETSASLSF